MTTKQKKVKNQDSVQEALLYVELVRAHEYLGAEFARLFKKHNISQAQYNTLRILYFRGREGGLPVNEIRKLLINMVPDVTRLVDRMITSGLVERTSDASDRRIVRVTLTPRGEELLIQLDRPVLSLHRQQFSHLSTNEVNKLLALLKKINKLPLRR